MKRRPPPSPRRFFLHHQLVERKKMFTNEFQWIFIPYQFFRNQLRSIQAKKLCLENEELIRQ